MGLTTKYIVPMFQDANSALGLSMILGLISIVFFNSKRKAEEQNYKKNYKKMKKVSTNSTNSDKSSDDEVDYSNLVPPHLPVDLEHLPFKIDSFTTDEAIKKSEEFYQFMNTRRTVRFFSSEHVDQRIIENLLKTAGTSPSGAHTEPWTFVAVKDNQIKEQIREIIELEEETNYLKRMGHQWTHDLKALRTDWNKAYLTEAPWLLFVFRQAYFPLPDGRRRVHYYNEISTGISTGLLLAAIHNAGLVALTSTPMNCGAAIRSILGRPSHEKLVTLLPVGLPRKDATVPKLGRKKPEEIMIIM